MFEERKAGNWNFSWAGIVLVVAFVLGVFWIFRQNPPEAAAELDGIGGSKWTSGKIAEGPLEVQARDLLTFRMDLNKRSTVDVTFTTGDNSKRLAFLIIRSDDLQQFKSGGEVQTFTNTGKVPRGTVKRVVDPGNYVLVFDNRMNETPIKITASDLSVE